MGGLSYLVGQFWLFMVIALLVGLATGWIACRHEPRTAGWGRWLPVAAALWLLGLVLTLTQTVNAGPARWLESALLLLPVWLAGCALGCWLRGILDPARAGAAVALAGAGAAAAPTARVAAAARPAALPTVKPYQWQAQKDASGITLTGYVPSEALREQLAAEARRELAPLTVTDRSQVAAGAPAGFEAMASATFGHLSRLDRGIGSLVDAKYTLTGVAGNQPNRDAALAAARALPPGFSLAKVDLGPVAAGSVAIAPADTGPAVAQPYKWRAERQADVALLSGHVASDEMRVRMLAAARSRFTGVRIEDGMTLASGQPPGLEGMATTAFSHLAKLQEGSASLSDRAYALTGTAATAADREVLLQAVRLLPAGFTLGSVDVRVTPATPTAESAGAGPAPAEPAAHAVVPEAPPVPAAAPTPAPANVIPALPEGADYVWQVRADGEALVLSGHLPSAEVRERVQASARAAAGLRPVVDLVELARGAPHGLADMAVAALQHVGPLDEGTATVSNDAYAISGRTGSAAMHAETMAAVNRLPLGFRLDYATIAGPERVSAAGDALAGDGLPGDGLAGERPMGLAAPRQGRGDDLKRIRGIGKQNEGRLHGLGIWHFDQIAAWTPSEVEWVGSYLAFVGRIEREDWVGQAKVLAAGGDTAFSGRVARGEVVTSLDDGSLGQGNTLALSGTRPPALGTPRAGTPDDLKLVNGIGRVIEQKLNAVGVWHFDQIAAMSDDELAWISGHVGFPGRALRENWRGECVVLAQGGETEHSRAVKAGKIPSSLAARKPEESGSGE